MVAQRIKNLSAIQETWVPAIQETWKPVMWETWVQSLGREDPLEEDVATHSSILAGRIPWTEEPGGATVHTVAKRVRRD